MLLFLDDTETSEYSEKEVPKELVRDIINREVFLYKGWQDVLKGSKTSEEVRVRSGAQAMVFYLITIFFFKEIGHDKYQLLGNEMGLEIDRENLFCLGSTIYRKEDLPRKNMTKDYVNTPPKIVFEVDVNVDTGKNSEMIYVSRKIQALLDFGVEKVIWIFGENEKVLVADSQKEWIITNWSANIEVLDGHILNLEKLDLEES